MTYLSNEIKDVEYYVSLDNSKKLILRRENDVFIVIDLDAQTKADVAQALAEAYTDAAISALVGSSPEQLNDLNELAAAIGDDPNFAANINSAIADRVTIASMNTETQARIDADDLRALLTDTRFTDQRTTLDGSVTTAKVAAANVDGVISIPSMRTLGTGALQALAGSHGLLTTGVHGIKANDVCTSLGVGSGAVASGLGGAFFGFEAGLSNTSGLNSCFGYKAGRLATTGIGVFIGYLAGASATTSSGVHIGYLAGNANTTGNGVYLGFQAGYTATTSSGVYVGVQAGFSATTGLGTYIGYQAGRTATTGHGTYIGYVAGYNATIGHGTYIGYLAGYSATTGSGIYLGFQAGYAPNTLSANATTSADEQVCIGQETGQASPTQVNGIVCLGFRATAGAANAMALGRLSVANHASSVAIGNATATTKINEVAFGPRSLSLLNATTIPSGTETGLYLEAGALKYRGSAGTITTLAAA